MGSRVKSFDANNEILRALQERPALQWLPSRSIDRTEQLLIGSLGNDLVYACAGLPNADGKFGHLHLHLKSQPSKKLNKNELSGGSGEGFFEGVQFKAEHQRYIRDGFIFAYCKRIGNVGLLRQLWNEDKLFRINLTWLARQKTRESQDSPSRARTNASTPVSRRTSESSTLHSAEKETNLSYSTDLTMDLDSDVDDNDVGIAIDEVEVDGASGAAGKALLNRRMRQLRDQMKAKDKTIKQVQDQLSSLHERNGELQADNRRMRECLTEFLHSEGNKDELLEKLRQIIAC